MVVQSPPGAILLFTLRCAAGQSESWMTRDGLSFVYSQVGGHPSGSSSPCQNDWRSRGDTHPTHKGSTECSREKSSPAL